MRTHSDRDIRMMVARSSVGEHHVPLDLAGANLEMANLPHVDLRGANLRGANLRGAMLWGAELSEARLDGADFTCANLIWGRLFDCSMKGTLLIEANLDEATLDFAGRHGITAGADMHTVNYGLSEAGSKRLQSQLSQSKDAVFAEMTEAQQQALLEAHIKTASPTLRQRGAAGWANKYKQLSQAQARILSDADIQELLRFSAETGKPLNLRGCNFFGADFRNASLDGACLACTNFAAADLSGASLHNADLTDSYGLDPATDGSSLLHEGVFALTGLTSRGGLSNWTCFFFPMEVVMLDAGLSPALKAGIIGGSDVLTVMLGDPAYGPQRGKQQALLDWYAQLRSKAKNILEWKDVEFEGARLHLRMRAHELFITGSDGKPHQFTLMNRNEAAPAIPILQQRLGARFEVTSTALFSLLNRRASFLTR